MTVIGYTRVSTDKQDLEKQKHLLLEHAQAKQMIIQEFIDAEVSSSRDTAERKIDELLSTAILLRQNETTFLFERSRDWRQLKRKG